ncbi:MAG: hypothetical protein AAFZ58_07995 [Pseudomonadota bacterium]
MTADARDRATKGRSLLVLARDLVIVVVGVFLGLQAQEWNERVTDRENERAYLERLSADFQLLGQELKGCVDLHRKTVEAVRFVSNRIESNKLGDDEHERFKRALIGMTAGDVPPDRSTTFIEMLSNGDLGLVRSVELRDALVEYDQLAQTNREIWRLLRAEISAYLPTLYRHIEVDVDLANIDDTVQRITTVQNFDWDGIVSDPAFAAMLNVLAGTNGNFFEVCVFQQKDASDVIELLAR